MMMFVFLVHGTGSNFPYPYRCLHVEKNQSIKLVLKSLLAPPKSYFFSTKTCVTFHHADAQQLLPTFDNTYTQISSNPKHPSTQSRHIWALHIICVLFCFLTKSSCYEVNTCAVLEFLLYCVSAVNKMFSDRTVPEQCSCMAGSGVLDLLVVCCQRPQVSPLSVDNV